MSSILKNRLIIIAGLFFLGILAIIMLMNAAGTEQFLNHDANQDMFYDIDKLD